MSMLKHSELICCILWGIASGVRIATVIDSKGDPLDIVILAMHLLVCAMYGVLAAKSYSND